LLLLLAAIVCLASAEKHCTGECQTADENAIMNRVMPIKQKMHEQCVAAGECPEVRPSLSFSACIDGKAGEYDCNGIDLLSYVSLADLGSTGEGSDIWGWTDPVTNSEIAIVCVEDGTSFVDITHPMKPKVLAFMSSERPKIIWHDVKVYKNHAYVISEAPDHGMQVFDLTKLREFDGVAPSGALGEVAEVPQVTPLTTYREFGSCHNIVINEETGFAYAVGTRTCRGGLHMVDIRDPTNPTFAGCFQEDGYVHDAQCVVYEGPDVRYNNGSEICFCYNEDTLTIVDVTDKSAPALLAREPYLGSAYTHQGWLFEGQTHLLLNDELDEMERSTGDGAHTRTMVWNVENLEKPFNTTNFFSSETSIDHNLYIRGNLAYEANYCAGLRVLDVSDHTELREVAFFDVSPTCSSPLFKGSWSVYPYFQSGSIVVNSIERGLFVLRLRK
jgi:choice-of-anchor B domain-containing protein